MRSLTFFNTEDFGAMREAEAFLQAAGFSIGYMQAHAPRGLLHGDFRIQKWRNLSANDRALLHGRVVGGRSAPVVVHIYETASTDAKEAFDHQVVQLRRKAEARA